ncbi:MULTISPECIES: Rrf2 family transcriptional regulator [unclassified Mesorhizobium]|uniref:RrF2 family transcriptional regulator n=2 Tax=Mesorhizobium TaxID=68287 RepID=UPI000FD24CAB|nr:MULTISPECIES: Rrf2 family transcriptional regulator [unclassified Mesorhizobium]RUX04506.1 Rrf2 family transcriptional regulator [Mesorhizobium sp. M8A.F.Ca.ET.023.01.1.1]TGR36657.1 Rrf2 family transcriptional regulator [bacterium M00.F.Ca.ET.199.01.1.1]TGU17034.1 Rrf2 family transcriptional regulator [bacterium M00.F.Ca.ET.156.01.1.1]TGV11888.1 Rrf2 family transcriptional regulator [Mesorhizobium sp. M8A.F.Ca.ET.173.01.1.1]TGV53083.1 Rrf2 family transcriptional regulator [bacterium M00.F.C
MKRNSRLSSTLHILVHMAEKPEQALTSEQLATFIHTNPVVVRRTIGGLRDAGIVTSSRGHGGGWLLGRAPENISLAEISVALGETLLPFSTEPESPGCLVEQAVIAVLDDFRVAAEKLLAEKLSRITLADLTADFRRRYALIGVSSHAV